MRTLYVAILQPYPFSPHPFLKHNYLLYDYIFYRLLRLDIFIYHNSLEVHPDCCINRVIFYYIEYDLFHYGRTSGLVPVFVIINKATLNICVHILFLFLWDKCPRGHLQCPMTIQCLAIIKISRLCSRVVVLFYIPYSIMHECSGFFLPVFLTSCIPFFLPFFFPSFLPFLKDLYFFSCVCLCCICHVYGDA